MQGRGLILAGLAAAVVVLEDPASAQGADARIVSIQVVQGVQFTGVDDNGVELVADKSTAIRALVDVANGTCARRSPSFNADAGTSSPARRCRSTTPIPRRCTATASPRASTETTST